MELNSARHQRRLSEQQQQLKSMCLSQWTLSWTWANRVFSLWIKWTTVWATLGREHGQQMKGNYYLSLFSDSESIPGIMCPVWGSPVQEGCWETGEGHAEGWWDSKWPTAYHLWRDVEEVGLGLPGRKESKGISDNNLKLSKGKWQRSLGWVLLSSSEWQNQKEKSQAKSLELWCVWILVDTCGCARLVTHRNVLPRKAGQSPSLKAFKGSLSKAVTDLQCHRSQSHFQCKAGQGGPQRSLTTTTSRTMLPQCPPDSKGN